MSDEGEKTCPLCAEEMDLTDQQLKPCKCGYEICVWCWHHIMDMAEKDQTEGRCPACRNPYNEEKIVGTAAKCERLVSEMNVEKKLRSQKGKSRTSEGRKQLGSVRVIQRNLVYVVGLPLNFADEDLLQRRDYFGQYGKVLKVSISRTAAGAIQHFANSTCSVYITYSKEEEAVRCIQSVHGFVFDGKPLRACFGTTKYCHAWLRNVPCSNPDCLYLHEIGSQEDSFTKDEIISAYTRSRVQNTTGMSNSLQCRSGNVLPPPADEYCNNSSASSGKPISKTAVNANNSSTIVGVSPPNSSAGRSAALPAGASWGARPSNSQPLPTSTPCSDGPTKQKPDSCNVPVTFTTNIATSVHVSSLPGDGEKKSIPSEEITSSQNKTKLETGESVIEKPYVNQNITILNSSSASIQPATLTMSRLPDDGSSKSKLPSSDTDTIDSLDRETLGTADGDMENICSDVLSMSIHGIHQLHNGFSEQVREPLTSQTSSKTANKGIEVTDLQSAFRQESSSRAMSNGMLEMEDDLLSFDRQRMKDPEVADSRVQDFSHELPLSKHSSICSPQFNMCDGLAGVDLDRLVDRNDSSTISKFPSWHPGNTLSSPEINSIDYSNVFPCKNKRLLHGRSEGEAASSAVDMGESSIISNILSMDFESWNESLTSPQNLAKLLGETDKQGPSGVPVSRNSNQSRFSFAREEESMGQPSHFGQSFDYFEQALKQRPFGQSFSNSSTLHLEKVVPRNGFSFSKSMESDISVSHHSHLTANKISVPASHISAPPGFAVPSRPPPPGFTSLDRTEQIVDVFSGNHMPEASSWLSNQYQTPTGGSSISNGDIEFIDPAILAVGKGTLSGSLNGPDLELRSNFSPQLNTYDDPRFQSFLQRSLSPHLNQRFHDMGDSFSALGEAHGIPSRVMEQTLVNNVSSFPQFNIPPSRNGITSNGQWDGWTEVQGGNSLGMAGLLRTERMGFNKFYGGYEDSKIQMPSSGSLFNGTYGI